MIISESQEGRSLITMSISYSVMGTLRVGYYYNTTTLCKLNVNHDTDKYILYIISIHIAKVSDMKITVKREFFLKYFKSHIEHCD